MPKSSQNFIKRKCKWYFIVRQEEGNTWEHAEEDRLGLSPEPDLITIINMLCDVQLTWHGGVKQRAAAALAETRITQSEPHCCQVHLLSGQCDSIAGNNTSRNHALAFTSCLLLSHLECDYTVCPFFFRQGCRACSQSRMHSTRGCTRLWKGSSRQRGSSDHWGASISPWWGQDQPMRSTSPAMNGSNAH